MPRTPRQAPRAGTFHLVRRGHNRANCFFAEGDRAHYLSLLARFSNETHTALHAFVLMSNHVHLLVSSDRSSGISRLMYLVGMHYSRAINRKIERTGTLWEDRLHASAVRSDAYVLACYRYIELNPVRAGMVSDPADYRWSSYASNAGIEPAAWITPHPTFASLGSSPERAALRYRELFRDAIDDLVLAHLRTAGEPLGPTVDPGSRGQPDANCSSASRA